MLIGVMLEDNTELCMVTIIRAGVVIEGVYRAVAHRAY